PDRRTASRPPGTMGVQPLHSATRRPRTRRTGHGRTRRPIATRPVRADIAGRVGAGHWLVRAGSVSVFGVGVDMSDSGAVITGGDVQDMNRAVNRGAGARKRPSAATMLRIALAVAAITAACS